MNELLCELQRELYRLAEQLGSDVRPGHPEYISMHAAAGWCEALANRMGEVAAAMETNGTSDGSEANDQA